MHRCAHRLRLLSRPTLSARMAFLPSAAMFRSTFAKSTVVCTAPRLTLCRTPGFASGASPSRSRDAPFLRPSPTLARAPPRVMSATPPTEVTPVPDANDIGTASRVVVVAVDESDDSVKALKWTIDNFYKPGDVLHVLHVIPYVHQQVLTSTVYYTPPVLDPEITEQLSVNAQEVMDEKFIPVLKEKKVTYEVDMIKEKGSETIGDAVCHAASDLGACAVVVAAHKKHWLQLWLMGSSSREIVGKAPIPVIVFHG